MTKRLILVCSVCCGMSFGVATASDKKAAKPERGSAAKAVSKPSFADAKRLVARWLAAAARKDVRALAKLSAVPLWTEVQGQDAKCNKRKHATKRRDLRRTLGCLIKAKMKLPFGATMKPAPPEHPESMDIQIGFDVPKPKQNATFVYAWAPGNGQWLGVAFAVTANKRVSQVYRGLGGTFE